MNKKLRKMLAFLLTFLMTFSMATVAFAQETKDDELLLAELKQEVKEINEYLQQNMKPLDIKNQTAKYVIPLSNGKEAEYTLTLTQVSKDERTILDAKLGTWYFDSTLKLANHGQVKTRTTVKITYVPSSAGSVPKFTAYDGTVTAIPDQFVSVDNTHAETVCIETNYHYKTTGYVGFNIAGIPANFYFDQHIAYVDNATNYNKIQVSLVGEF